MSRIRLVASALVTTFILLAAGCGGAASSSTTTSSKPAGTSTSSGAAASSGSSSGSSGSSSGSYGSSSSGSKSQAAAAKSSTPLKFLLDWQVEGYQAPFFLGVKNGDYKAAGLKVTLTQGHGSGSTTNQVAHGNYPMGFADAGTAATAISKGEPVKVVACLFQKSPVAVIFKASEHITKPSDLIGKTIATSAGSASNALFSAFLAANHMTKKQVHMENMSSSSKTGALEANKVDAALDYDIDTLPLLRAKGMKAADLPFADWGVNALSTAVIVNDTFLKQHPNVVRSFVHATQKAWAQAEKDPNGAIAAEKALTPRMPPNAIGMLKQAFQLLHTKNSQGHPLGWMSPQDWTTTLQILHKYLGVKNIKAPSAYYTNQFVS